MSKAPQDIIIRPLITEESMAGAAYKKYSFVVAKDANKIEIAQAVEALFEGAKVCKVNAMNCLGTLGRYGRFAGMTSSWKKAIVTLTEDSKTIEFFDGLM